MFGIITAEHHSPFTSSNDMYLTHTFSNKLSSAVECQLDLLIRWNFTNFFPPISRKKQVGNNYFVCMNSRLIYCSYAFDIRYDRSNVEHISHIYGTLIIQLPVFNEPEHVCVCTLVGRKIYGCRFSVGMSTEQLL